MAGKVLTKCYQKHACTNFFEVFFAKINRGLTEDNQTVNFRYLW